MRSSTLDTEGAPFRTKPSTVTILERDGHGLAQRWVQHAIALGRNPLARQEPLAVEDAGEWKIVTVKDDEGALSGKELPEELWDEVFIELLDLGRVTFDGTLKVWHGNFLADDASARALALRLRTARQALGLSLEQFYGSCGVGRDTAEALERARGSVGFPSWELAGLLSRRHGIPELWLCFGLAVEMEAVPSPDE